MVAVPIYDKDNYLIACGRYIEMNPVRARIAGVPEDYPRVQLQVLCLWESVEKMEDEFGVKNLKNRRGRPVRANK